VAAKVGKISYTEEELRKLVERPGLIDTEYKKVMMEWAHRQHLIHQPLSSERNYYKLMYETPLEDVPLWIHHELVSIREIASWRLEIAR
jgi:hypothetical protein